ncbi:MAG: adenylate/guanylate cyclase domain-containing protein, partial [Pseudomonadota bacterium]
DFGTVTFGNIGSPDRLDFTVVGSAVNVASRVQGLCKNLNETLLVTTDVQKYIQTATQSLGSHALKGLGEEVEVFRISAPGG